MSATTFEELASELAELYITRAEIQIEIAGTRRDLAAMRPDPWQDPERWTELRWSLFAAERKLEDTEGEIAALEARRRGMEWDLRRELQRTLSGQAPAQISGYTWMD